MIVNCLFYKFIYVYRKSEQFYFLEFFLLILKKNLFLIIFIFINNQSKQRKLLKGSLLFVLGKKHFFRMNGVRVTTVIVSAKRAARVDRVRRSFFSDVSL